MWSKLGIRLFSALIGVIFVICMIFSPIQIFTAGIAAVIYVALYEYNNTVYKNDVKWQIVFWQYLAATVSVCVATRFGHAVFPPVFAAYAMLIFICSIIWNEKIKFPDVLAAVFAIVYAAFPAIYLIFIKSMADGMVLIFLPLLGAWMPDTFAYFTGVAFGKHKLIPAISPKKTVEGSIGAVLGCVLIFSLYGVLLLKLGFSVNFAPLIILSVLCGILAQFGDLSASLIKRQFGVKDFGKLMPGHGGILDRIDSLIFIAPLTYYFLTVLPVIG